MGQKQMVRALLGSLILGLASAAATASVFPADPTELDNVRVVATYNCPYPATGVDPEISQTGNQIEVLVILNGSICFSGEFAEVTYAIDLGQFEKGDYEITLRHTTVFTQPLIVGPVYEFDFQVNQTVSPRFGGVWSDDSSELHAVNLTFVEADSALLSWQTYDPDGNPLWLTGTATVVGDELIADMFSGARQAFGQFDGRARRELWGEVKIRFRACDQAIMNWRPIRDGYQNGSLPLSRLGISVESEGCVPDADFFLPN